MTTVTSDFFIYENIFLTLFIVSGLFCFIPIIGLNIQNDFIPVWIMEHHEIVWIFFKICLQIHLFEALLAFLLAGFYYGMSVKTTFKWTLNTFIHGVFSLRHLTWKKQ